MIWGWQYFKVFKATYTGRAEYAQAENAVSFMLFSLKPLPASEKRDWSALARS